jgi:hypothetical protein
MTDYNRERTRDLEDFTLGAARDLGFPGDGDPRRLPSIAELVDQDAATAQDDELEATDDQDEPDDDAEYDDLSAAFWESLSAEDRAAAERSSVVRDGLWAAYVAESGYEIDEDDEDDEDIEQSAADSPTGLDMIAAAYANPDGLTSPTGEPLTPAQWISWALHASEEAWARACDIAGWDPRVRISNEDVRIAGRGVQGETIATDWAAHVARLQDQGRKFGE